MLKKMVPILSFIFLAIIPSYAASPEQPNSVTTESNMRKPDIFDTISDNEINSIATEPNKWIPKGAILVKEEQPNSVPVDQNAIKAIIDKANKGDPNSQRTMGLMYYLGEYVRQDYNEALKWYTKAAQQGNANAQQELGEIYCFGVGVPKNYIEAAKWYRKAAEQGLVLAQYNLGTMYEDGEGVEQDEQEAVKWHRKAAEQGFVKAQSRLGWIYYHKGWITSSQGKNKTTDLYSVSQDYNEAAKWFRMAAEQGDAKAQSKLGSMYSNGEGVPKNYKEAIKWYTKAAEQGDLVAQNNLAVMYTLGEGVIEDYVEAYRWALIAGMNGMNVTVVKQNLIDRMTRAQIAEAQRRAKEFVAKKENEKDEESFGLEEKTSPKSAGTGFFISSSGYMITAAHVVKKARSLQIFTSSGKYQAKVLLLDEPTDIAILKVSGAEFPYLEVISSSAVAVGDKVFTVGFPNVPVQGTESKYTDGTISSLSGIDNNIRHFQISIPVQTGNSGGPLLSANGEVVGVIVSRLDDIGMLEATGTLPQNVNYAVKSAFIFPLLENITDWQSLKAKPSDETLSNSKTINKARNSVALILVY